MTDPGPDRLPVPLDTSYEVALDAEPDRAPVPVDLVPEAGALLPVIPQHLRTRAGVQAAAARSLARQKHRVEYHGIRSPVYLVLALVWAVAGVFKIAGKQARWGWVLHAVPLEFEAARSGDGREFRSMHKELRKTRAFRGRLLAGEVLLIAAAVALMAWYAPWWGWVLLALVVVPVLARAGRPADRRIVSQAVVSPRYRTLSADVVLRAYYAAKLHDPGKPDYQVTFASPMARDHEGSGVHVDLPYGKGLKDAIAAKDALASGLDVQVSQVFFTRDASSNRRHYLWVADRDPLAIPVGKTPLLDAARTGKAADIWKAAPMGLDERGQLVTLLLMWHSVLVGGMPRQGKTWTSRQLALFAALDPFVQMDVFDATAKPDWRRFDLVAESCAFGLTPTRDGKPPEILLNTLIRLKEDVERRYTTLSGLPTDVCPEGKLTRKLARDPRLNMPVRILVVGEVQEYFLLGDISKAIAELLVYLVKVAPGAGVIVLSDTQKPSGIGSGYMGTQFVNFRDQHQVRFALRTPSWGVSDLVLGDGAYSMGLDSSQLLPQYKGVGILRGATDANPTTRNYEANDNDAEKILKAARALRERAGTLTGMAAGIEAETPARDVLADVLSVFGTDAGLHWQVLAARLAKQLPERWEDATGDSVSADLRALGVESVNVKAYGRVLRGCRREDVERAAGR